MTKTQSTSKSSVGSSRKRFLASVTEERGNRAGRPAKLRRGAKRRAAGRGDGSNSIDAVLRQGREGLASAESVLACLHVALLYAEDLSIRDNPDYASAVAIAITMLREVRDQLDAASLRPLLAARSRPTALRRTKRR